MEKEKYISPEMEIIEFETEDIIITSGDGVDGDPNAEQGIGGQNP